MARLRVSSATLTLHLDLAMGVLAPDSAAKVPPEPLVEVEVMLLLRVCGQIAVPGRDPVKNDRDRGV